MRASLSPLSHGGVRPLHQKPTCLMQLTLGPHAVHIWSRNPLELKGNETRVLHRVSWNIYVAQFVGIIQLSPVGLNLSNPFSGLQNHP